jgi:hypothetical protein
MAEEEEYNTDHCNSLKCCKTECNIFLLGGGGIHVKKYVAVSGDEG